MRIIPLFNGGEAFIDDADAEIVAAYKWQKSPLGYAVTYCTEDGKTKAILMHRMLLNAVKGVSVDHINHDLLDNRRENLRLCTHAENMKNRKIHKNNALGVKGVCAEGGRYRARIAVDGKRVSLGCFDSASDAYSAYQIAAKKLHGEFAHAPDVCAQTL